MTLTATPNATQTIRDWLRSISEVVAAVGSASNIATGLPASGKAIVVARSGGGDDRTATTDQSTVAVDCWSSAASKSEDVAWGLAGLVIAAARIASHVTVNDAIIDGVNVLGSLWAPDDTGRPRYVVTLQATIRSV